jgi:tetrahydromethanopterin S-methyltransferase subunit B
MEHTIDEIYALLKALDEKVTALKEQVDNLSCELDSETSAVSGDLGDLIETKADEIKGEVKKLSAAPAEKK